MNVVLLASEAVPFATTGGLGGVMGALPPALSRQGAEVSLVLPCHRSVWQSGVAIGATGRTLRVPVGSKTVEASVYTGQLPDSDVTVFLIDQAGYFDRDPIYQRPDGHDYPDNAERFAFFCRASVELIRRLPRRPDVVHANDWQTGLVPCELKEFGRGDLEGVGTLFTVHNLAYQGHFPPSDLALTGLDPRLLNWRQMEFHGRLSFLKAGLVFADMISTVSPALVRMVQTPEFGFGLDGLFRDRRDDLRGIVNGLPPRHRGSAHDLDSLRSGKAARKEALQRLVSLPVRPEVPLMARLGRPDPQKSCDPLVAAADDLLGRDVQLVVPGEGPPSSLEWLGRLAERHPGKVGVLPGSDRTLAHQTAAGADLLVTPSPDEVWGVNQPEWPTYGTVPVVPGTTELADLVVDATPDTLADGTATGFVFHDPTPEGLRQAVLRALTVWDDRVTWDRLVTDGIRADRSWDRRAGEYLALYEEVRRRADARAVRGVSGTGRAALATAV